MKKFNYARLALLMISWILISACTTPEGNQASISNSDKNAETISSAAVEQAALQIDEEGFMQHVNVLASDEFEGRAPSTPGGTKTVEYLESEFQKLGLQPAFDDSDGKSYRQPVELMELTVTNAPALVINHSDGTSDSLSYKEEAVVSTSRVTDTVEVSQSELVYVGYGVVAPEYNWNDYQGIDMAGKTAVILVNDPGFRATTDELFKGNTMTYYGRWSYKYEEAARQGATGAIIIHETAAAGYPWEVVSGGWSGSQYNLLTEDGNQSNLAIESWITQTAAENLFSKNGLNYAEMVTKAGQQGFNPVMLSSSASSTLQIETRQSVSFNVAGLLPGSERPDELFIYTAHWDHLGIKSEEGVEDTIYNGAQDNATGTAALIELAQAFVALPTAPQRSVMFLAVTAEESGLLGSQQYAESPAFPMSKTVAGINIDGMSTIGATDDIVVVGYGNSQLDDYLRTVSDTQGRTVVREPTPEKGFFYRSDHFNLAKKGVPMLYAKAGIQVRGKPTDYGETESNRYIAERYHKASDEVHAGWDNGGILQDLYANFHIGYAISNSNDWPMWSDGNEFKAIREASLQQ